MLLGFDISFFLFGLLYTNCPENYTHFSCSTEGSLNDSEWSVISEEDIFESKFSSNLSFDNDEQRKLFEDWDNEIMANNNHNNQNDVPLEYSDFEDDEFVLMGSQEDLEESFIYLD